jgi:phosphoribosyl 1,2-cyclic phosphate phosphodiesterase
MKTMDDDQAELLEGVEVLCVNALRFEKPHHSHQLVDDALAFAKRVGAKRTLITHVCHDVGLHEDVNKKLPAGAELAFDGQVVLID